MFHNNGHSCCDEELEEFVCSSNNVIDLKFVSNYDDFMNDDLSFAPSYTHQLFENEKIYGYKNIKIKLYYTPDNLDTFIGITYDSKVNPQLHKGTKPDDIIKLLLEWVPEGFSVNEDHYISMLSHTTSRPFCPFGELLHVFSKDDEQYEIYKVDLKVPGFIEYLEKLQTFIILFIEAGSFIDTDDDNWTFYVMYRKEDISTCNRNYTIIGYSSVYSYYAYPNRIRPRISQLLILPPYQRKGLGGQLLQCIYNDLIPNTDVLDITVEDPSPEFTALRDYTDCYNALQKLPCYSDSPSIPPYGKEIETMCREKLKLNKIQARRVYEILKLRQTNKQDSLQYTQYRLFVKNRLNGPYKKQQNDLEKLHKSGIDQVELIAAVPLLSIEERMKLLHEEYQLLENDYTKVIEKLATN